MKLALIGFRGGEERLPAAPGIVDELEEAEIGGELLLRDAPVGPEPGAQQRPEAFGRVDVHLAEAVAVLVAGVLAPRVAQPGSRLDREHGRLWRVRRSSV